MTTNLVTREDVAAIRRQCKDGRPPTALWARRLCDTVDELRARLAELEAVQEREEA